MTTQSVKSEAPAEMATGNFMAITAKSKVAIIVPLFGFWNDVEDNLINGEVLSVALRHMQSKLHNVTLILVGHDATLQNEEGNPHSVVNVIKRLKAEGDVMQCAVPRTATYVDYVEEGMDAALNSTKATFICVFNPWVLTQEGAIEVIVDRTNFGDNAKIVSGFNMRPLLDPNNPTLFETYKTNMPREELDLSLNFLCMPRYIAELLTFDSGFETHRYLERDWWQTIMSARFHAITTQRIPIFEFDFPWEDYETKEQLQSDEYKFVTKWRFSPGIIN